MDLLGTGLPTPSAVGFPPQLLQTMRLSALLCLGVVAAEVLLRSSASTLSQNSTLVCRDVSQIAPKDQCAFVKTHCNLPTYQIGCIDYLRFYYCLPSVIFNVLSFLALGLAFFLSLALTASDYLCPNLYSISKFLRLSDNLAGLTLLALGNGSADVVSTFKALDVGAPGLAVSELLGAALFILTVVVGTISIVSPFKVPRFHFIRDVLFYFLIISVVLVSLIWGSFNYANATALVALYAMYVFVVIYSHSRLAARAAQSANIARLRSNFDESHVPYSDNITLDFLEELVQHPQIDSLTVSETEDEFAEYNVYLATHPGEERVPIVTGSYGLKMLMKELSKHSIHGERQSAPVTESLLQNAAIADLPRDLDDSLGATLKRILLPAFPEDASLYSLPLFVASYPASLALRLTTPNREQAIEFAKKNSSNAFTFTESETDGLETCESDFVAEEDSLLFGIQILVAPLFLGLAYLGNTPTFWVTLVPLLILGFSIRYVAQKSMSKSHSHPWNYIGSFLGFVVSMTWISVFATEIVAILKALAVICKLSDEIVGATVFALGNSVGDLVSNMTIARMGMPMMAFGACFGGPILSICSLGLSAAIVLYHSQKAAIPIEFSTTLQVNSFALIATLGFMGFVIPRNGWNFDKKVGIALISIWAVASTATVVFEFS